MFIFAFVSLAEEIDPPPAKKKKKLHTHTHTHTHTHMYIYIHTYIYIAKIYVNGSIANVFFLEFYGFKPYISLIHFEFIK